MSLDDQALNDHYREHTVDCRVEQTQPARVSLANQRQPLAHGQATFSHALPKAIGRSAPRDVYVSTASWLNPIDLPRLRDNPEHYPVLPFRL